MKRTRKKMRRIALKLMSNADRNNMQRGDSIFTHNIPYQIRKATIQTRVENKIKASQARKAIRLMKTNVKTKE